MPGYRSLEGRLALFQTYGLRAIRARIAGAGLSSELDHRSSLVSVSSAEVDGVCLVDEVGFAGALVAEFVCELLQLLAEVGHVDVIEVGDRVELLSQCGDASMDGLVSLAEFLNAMPESRFVALDCGEQARVGGSVVCLER